MGSLRALLVALLLIAAPLAGAAEARRYAVLSLIGDKLLIVTHNMSTGSRLDRNQRDFITSGNALLDNGAALAMEDALKEADPEAPVILLSVRDPRIFALQSEMLDGSNSTESMIAGLRAALGEIKATHLLIATKYRHDAMLTMVSGNVGSGTLEGLGFYIDHVMRVTNTRTLESATGFLAPFAYFRFSLIDLSSWKVVREERVTASHVTSTASSRTGHPWEAMTSAAKVRTLQGMVRKEALAVVPALVR